MNRRNLFMLVTTLLLGAVVSLRVAGAQQTQLPTLEGILQTLQNNLDAYHRDIKLPVRRARGIEDGSIVDNVSVWGESESEHGYGFDLPSETNREQ